jgi:hypothetical protein
MKRTTLVLHDRLERELRLLAKEERRSTDALAREAIEEYVARRRRSRLGFLAVGRSGRADVAERHDELLFARLAPHGQTRLRLRSSF